MTKQHYNMPISQLSIDAAISFVGIVFSAFNLETPQGKIIFILIAVYYIVRIGQSLIGSYHSVKPNKNEKDSNRHSRNSGT